MSFQQNSKEELIQSYFLETFYKQTQPETQNQILLIPTLINEVMRNSQCLLMLLCAFMTQPAETNTYRIFAFFSAHKTISFIWAVNTSEIAKAGWFICETVKFSLTDST